MAILEVFKDSVERPVPVRHHLFSQYVGHLLQLSNYFTIIQQSRPNLHSLAKCFWEDNVVWFVFAKRFDELGIWKVFSIELFQMLAVVCRLVNLYVIYLQNYHVRIIHLTHIQCNTTSKSIFNGEEQLFIIYSAN